jgi:hypothetical protein
LPRSTGSPFDTIVLLNLAGFPACDGHGRFSPRAMD